MIERKPKQVLLPPPRPAEDARTEFIRPRRQSGNNNKKTVTVWEHAGLSLFGAAARFGDVAGDYHRSRAFTDGSNCDVKLSCAKRSSTSAITNAYPNFTLRRAPRASLRCTSCVYSVTSERLLVQVQAAAVDTGRTSLNGTRRRSRRQLIVMHEHGLSVPASTRAIPNGLSLELLKKRDFGLEP